MKNITNSEFTSLIQKTKLKTVDNATNAYNCKNNYGGWLYETEVFSVDDKLYINKESEFGRLRKPSEYDFSWFEKKPHFYCFNDNGNFKIISINGAKPQPLEDKTNVYIEVYNNLYEEIIGNKMQEKKDNFSLKEVKDIIKKNKLKPIQRQSYVKDMQNGEISFMSSYEVKKDDKGNYYTPKNFWVGKWRDLSKDPFDSSYNVFWVYKLNDKYHFIKQNDVEVDDTGVEDLGKDINYQKVSFETPQTISFSAMSKLISLAKSDAKEAAYKTAASQTIKLARNAILLGMQNKGADSTTVQTMKNFLATEFGIAFLSLSLGIGIEYIDKINADERVKKLAQCFRINGMATVGNEIMSSVVEEVFSQINSVVTELPKEDVRVEVKELFCESDSIENDFTQSNKIEMAGNG
ncbi:MAG: hypothetical protein LC122_02660 [Chitinophagales bacterium]|nr:hypothetical protein [Chitinophagales bacterium]